MKKTGLVSFILIAFITFTTSALAHIPGQPPFFRINGELTDYYEIVSDNPSESFPLPQDISPRPFLVDEEIAFEIDKTLLPFPEEVISETTFTWDYGDGTDASGLTQTYAYTKPGTYLLQIQADYGKYSSEAGGPTKIQSLFVDVVPDENFSLPKAAFTVNDKGLDPKTNYIEVNLSEEITLKGSSSTPSEGSRVTSYTWYFDTGEVKEGEVVTITYENNPYLATPILRITDSKGFISDTQITLKNTHFQKNTPASKLIIIVPILIFLGGLLIVAVFKLRQKKLP